MNTYMFEVFYTPVVCLKWPDSILFPRHHFFHPVHRKSNLGLKWHVVHDDTVCPGISYQCLESTSSGRKLSFFSVS